MKTPSLFLIFFVIFAVCACENPWMAEILEPKTVTFETNGGTSVPSQTLFKGERVKQPADPTKNGFKFVGWYWLTNNEMFYEPYDFAFVPITDITLYAEWDTWDTILIFTDIDEFEKFLSEQPVNTSSNPYIIKLKIDDTDILLRLKETLLSYENKEKYVTLDFSDSSITGIGDHAFSNCHNLVSITIPDSLTDIGNGVFEGCENLTSINVNNNNNTYSSKDGVLYNQDKTVLIACPCGKTGEFVIPDSVITISDFAFPNCTKLTNIIIGKKVAAIGNYAFHSCSGLTKITIPDNVINIGNNAFYDCTDLTDVTIGKNVETIGGYAFYLCGKLDSVTFEGTINQNGFEINVFEGLGNLRDVFYANNNQNGTPGTYKKDASGSWYKL